MYSLLDAWFEDTPVISQLPPKQAAQRLRELGEDDVALALEQAESARVRRPSTFGIFDYLPFGPKPWMHASHVFGFLAADTPDDAPSPIIPTGQLQADTGLKNSRLNIVLNRLRVADYPGSGTHRILFDFYAQNQLAQGAEHLHFNTTLRVEEGGQAGVVGYPIFIGLNVGSQGLAFKCFTVNVKNDQDEAFLSMLDSDVFKTGLQLATVAQPALIPLSTLAMGLTKSIAGRYRNFPVQDIYLGLDFSGSRMGARLALGDYIAVQIPGQLQNAWNWNDWMYYPETGEVLNTTDRTLIPFNYIVFGVSRYEED